MCYISIDLSILDITILIIKLSHVDDGLITKAQMVDDK